MPQTDWQPTDPPPTDGRDRLVVYVPGGRQLVARFDVTQTAWVADGVGPLRPGPTHYQELPTPPEPEPEPKAKPAPEAKAAPEAKPAGKPAPEAPDPYADTKKK